MDHRCVVCFLPTSVQTPVTNNKCNCRSFLQTQVFQRFASWHVSAFLRSVTDGEGAWSSIISWWSYVKHLLNTRVWTKEQQNLVSIRRHNQLYEAKFYCISWSVDTNSRCKRWVKMHDLLTFKYWQLYFSGISMSDIKKKINRKLKVCINRLNVRVTGGGSRETSARPTHVYCRGSVQVCHAVDD